MTEGAKKPRRPVPLIAAAVLSVLVFGAGIFAGRSIPERSPSAAAKNPAERPADRATQAELSACHEKLAARLRARATPSDAAAPPDEANRDAGERPATVETLEGDLSQCKRRSLLTSAEVCVAAERQFHVLMALPEDGVMCGPKSRAADLVEDNFESCAEFADIPPGHRADELTKEQASLVEEAIRIQRTLTEDELLRRLKEFVFTCTEGSPKYPPGVDWSKQRKPNEVPL